MNAYQSQRIRFGILAARHMLERDRLTDWQRDDLEGMRVSGWRVAKDGTVKAFRKESDAALMRKHA